MTHHHASGPQHEPEQPADACCPDRQKNRRSLLKMGAAATMAASLFAERPIRGDEPSDASRNIVRIGLVGCGGRGGGAINDTLTINDGVQVVSLADIDPRKLARLRKSISKAHGDKVKITDDKMHQGIDGYKRVLDDPDVDLVLFATPPGFRPRYVLEAVQAGKHVFAEKPVCVDPVGYQICLQADQLARENRTAIVTGTQYRRQTNYVEAIQRIHDGAIGDIVSATTRYCTNGIWYRSRKKNMSDIEYQIYNWMHFIWLSGDQIAEQAVHNLDVINWVMGGPPQSAYGSGGRFTRPADSELWDNMAVDYVYPGNRVLSLMCRQIPSTAGANSNVIYGTKGTATIYGINRGASIVDQSGAEVWAMRGDLGAAYKQEHRDLVESIRSGAPIVEFKQTADSSLTAVLGRLAAYTGQEVTWDFVTNQSKLDLFPAEFDIQQSRPDSGFAVPGRTKLS